MFGSQEDPMTIEEATIDAENEDSRVMGSLSKEKSFSPRKGSGDYYIGKPYDRKSKKVNQSRLSLSLDIHEICD